MRKKRIDPDGWALLIDGKERSISDVSELRRRISAASRKKFAEVQLVRGKRPEHNLFALFNGGRAIMSYTRNIDEAFYSARSDNESRHADDQTMEFFYANGECDEYPLPETISTSDAIKSFEYFFQHVDLMPWLKWHKEF